MQAVTGFEQAIGGAGNDPIAATWIPIDMTGGWIAAAGILAGLYARAETGRGQHVATSLLGAGMLLQSGVFQRDGTIRRGPELDAAQTGYGPGYRLYEGADGKWFALVLPDEVDWTRLRAVPGLAALDPRYAPLRRGADDQSVSEAEAVLAAAFRVAPAAVWVERLRAIRLAVEPVADLDRDGFRQGILDDPLNRQLGRVVGYETEAWGHFEQIGPLIRCGPAPAGRPALMLPGIGEHSVEVLTELGFGVEEVDALLADKVVRQ
jgi:crotonobetainyl-CoA:carnitine CoA-transferase CaiB-like acyl-CoA transferase